MTTSLFKVPLCPGKNGYVRYSRFPKELVEALIYSEDGSFFSHQGFDWFEIKESFKQNWRKGRIARGGSTITQQLAKNMYLTSEKTISRKIKEYFVAKDLEDAFTKPQILERYLNIVEFGPKLFGAPKAAQKYFQKTVSDLSFLESVYLISLLPSPKRLSKGFNNRTLSRSNQYRMKIIIRRFYRRGKIDKEYYDHYLDLIENTSWPFGNTFEVAPSFISEMEEELENLKEDIDSEYLGNENTPENDSTIDEEPESSVSPTESDLESISEESPIDPTEELKDQGTPDIENQNEEEESDVYL